MSTPESALLKCAPVGEPASLMPRYNDEEMALQVSVLITLMKM